MLNRNEASTELGTIKIHRDSVASIAAIAATEIDGVKSVGKNMKSRLMELLDKKDQFDKSRFRQERGSFPGDPAGDQIQFQYPGGCRQGPG